MRVWIDIKFRQGYYHSNEKYPLRVFAGPNVNGENVEFLKQCQKFVVQQQPVGLEAEMHVALMTQRIPDSVHGIADKLLACQQGLAAMKNDVDVANSVRGGMLGNPKCDRVDYRTRHYARPKPPPLIGHLVHVAVIALQITALVNL